MFSLPANARLIKTYSGKPGCMCGCRGNWTYTEYGAYTEYGTWNHNSLTGPNIKESVAKRQATKVLKSDMCATDEYSGRLIVFTETETRRNAAYYEL